MAPPDAPGAAPAPEPPAHFSSRLALVLSVLGIAVGTGNIWRFPRIVAQNGGDDGAGGFLIAWVVFLVVWSLPLIVAEYAVGLRTRRGVVGAFAALSAGRLAWMGAFVGAVAAAIMCYYAVVTGWCAYYFGAAALGPAPADTEAARAAWEAFQASPWPAVGLVAVMGAAGLVITRGVRAIERVSLVLLPALLAIVLLCVVRAVTLPGAGAGLAYLFSPDLSVLAEPTTWLEALTQNAWDTGAGWGLILTYAAYMKREHGVVRNAVLTGVGNNTVSILAATMIFGTVFAVLGARGMATPEILAVMRDSGPASTGLTFIWTPQLFAQMPLGRPLGVLFFVGLSFAAFTSLVSMVELVVRVLVDWGVGRGRATWAAVAGGTLLGLPSALSLDVLGNQDFVWGVGLMISGAFIAVLVARYGTDRLRSDVATPGDWRLPRAWDALVRWGVPLQAAVLLVWWGQQATTAGFLGEGGRWWDPLNPYSLMTCLVQWAAVLALAIAANGWMVRRLRAGGPPGGEGPLLEGPPDGPALPVTP